MPEVTLPRDHHGGEWAALIHREIVQALILISLAVAAFLVTRSVAASNRTMNARDAAEAFRRGELAMSAGRTDEAASWFRRARARDRGDKTYALALARALLRQGDADAARTMLMTLRESAPEDPEINLALAAAAQAQSQADDAVRFYRNALYAPWPANQNDARNRVRVALIHELLAEGRKEAALGELIALSSTIEGHVADVLELAELFDSAGDRTHALQQYERVLQLDAANGRALSGAGQAAFELGNFPLAVRYLARAPQSAPGVTTSLQIARLVLSEDPLGARLGAAERRRRLSRDLEYLEQRLTGCLAAAAPASPLSDRSLLDEVRAFSADIRAHAVLSQDTVESGVDLIDRGERYLKVQCGPAGPQDSALTLIAERHRTGAS
jgi:tetratricopeptide (TPR) repeat protein